MLASDSSRSRAPAQQPTAVFLGKALGIVLGFPAPPASIMVSYESLIVGEGGVYAHLHL
jgi:hypothetical protein